MDYKLRLWAMSHELSAMDNELWAKGCGADDTVRRFEDNANALLLDRNSQEIVVSKRVQYPEAMQLFFQDLSDDD